MNSDYILNLQKIASMYNVDEGLNALGKKDLTLEQKVNATRVLGSAIHGSPDSFLNEADVHTANEAQNYQQVHQESVEEAVGKYKGQILDDYVGVINQLFKENFEKNKSEVSKMEEFKKASDEEKKAMLKNLQRQLIIEGLKNLLLDLELNDKYKEDEDLVESFKQYKTLRDKEDPTEVLEGYVKQRQLSSNAVNNTYLRNRSGKIKSDMLEIYAQVAASKLLNENGSIDKEKLGKAFDTVESYKAMTRFAAQKYQPQH